MFLWAYDSRELESLMVGGTGTASRHSDRNRKPRAHILKHKHEAGRGKTGSGGRILISKSAPSDTVSLATLNHLNFPKQTVPSVGDQVFKCQRDTLIPNSTRPSAMRPSEFADRSHPDQFSIHTHHTENKGHTLHRDHTPTTQTTLKLHRSHQPLQITSDAHRYP